MTRLDFAAQFGGGDAAEALLPHFRRLKLLAKQVSLETPYVDLTFVLRVDGDVRAFGFSGPGRVVVDKDLKGIHLTVDLGVSRTDWEGQSDHAVASFLAGAMVSSVAKMSSSNRRVLVDVDKEALASAIALACRIFLADGRT